MNYVKQVENPTTGILQFALLRKDADGFDLEPIFMGKDFMNCYEAIDNEDKLDILKDAIEKKLADDFLHNDKREILKKSLIKEVDIIKVKRNNNISDAIYNKYNEAGKEAVKLLRTLNR